MQVVIIIVNVLLAMLPIAVIAGIVAAVLRARRGHPSRRVADAGLGTVRRLFLYGVGLVALVLAGVGISLLLGGALDAAGGDTVIAESDTELAIALSFSIVGIPAWLLAAMIAQRSVASARAAELASETRRLYLNLARAIALVILVINGLAAARFVLGVTDYDVTAWGWTVAWGAIWLLHDRIAAAEPATSGPRLIDRLYLSFGAVLGLYVLLSASVAVVAAVLTPVYDGAFRAPLLGFDWSEELRAELAAIAVGGIVWVSHWVLRLKRSGRLSAAWQVVVFLFGVLPGLSLTLVAAALGLHTLLQWWIGEPSAESAAEHFERLPWTAGLAVAGLMTWVYYRSVLDEGQLDSLERTEPERVYRYLVAAAGLVVLIVGIVTALALAIDVLTPTSAIRSGGWWRNQIVLAITFIGVGIPVWAYYWSDIQRVVARTVAERMSLARRVYLFAIFGVASLVFLMDLTIVLFNLFDAALGDGLSREVFVDSRWNVALVLTASIAAGYHWLVLREDQRAYVHEEKPEIRGPRDVILLTAGDADALIRRLGELPDVRFHVWRRTGEADGAELSPERMTALREQIEETRSDCLVLVSGSGDFQLEPFEADEAALIGSP